METKNKNNSNYNNNKKCYISIKPTTQDSLVFLKFNFYLWNWYTKLFYTEQATFLPYI